MSIGIKPSKIPTTIHLIGKNSKVMKEVYDMLEEDYPENAISWVKKAKWQGPMVVPLSTIDFSNEKNWSASKKEDQDHVNDFVKEISNDAFVKPIVLVNEPNNKKLLAVDGRHRLLAYKKLRLDPMAYVGTVDEIEENTYNNMHGKQKGDNISGGPAKKESAISSKARK